MQGREIRIGVCDVHNKREVVAEIKLHNGKIIQLCHEVLRGKAQSIVHRLQKMSDKLEGNQQPPKT